MLSLRIICFLSHSHICVYLFIEAKLVHKLCKFQVYNIIIWYLHTLQSDHHPKPSYCSSPSSWAPTPILPTPTPFPIGDYQPVLCTCKFLVIFLGSMSKWSRTVFVIVQLAHFTEHNNTFRVHPCRCKWQEFVLFYGQVAFHYYCTTFLSIYSSKDT